MKRFLLSALALCVVTLPEAASAEGCQPTPPATHAMRYPGENAIVPSGNLALPAGKSDYPDGERVYLTGRVLDRNCVPVSGAVVDIWHPAPDGRFVRSTRTDRNGVEPHFTGSGRAVTDNLGHFRFVTLFPGADADRAPAVQVHITHPHFPALDTALYFASDPRNGSDALYARLPDNERQLLIANIAPRYAAHPEEAVNAEWTVVLNGVDAHRHY